jgi:hypothetical protein
MLKLYLGSIMRKLMYEFMIRYYSLKFILFKIDHIDIGMGETNKPDMDDYQFVRIMTFSLSWT